MDSRPVSSSIWCSLRILFCLWCTLGFPTTPGMLVEGPSGAVCNAFGMILEHAVQQHSFTFFYPQLGQYCPWTDHEQAVQIYWLMRCGGLRYFVIIDLIFSQLFDDITFACHLLKLAGVMEDPIRTKRMSESYAWFERALPLYFTSLVQEPKMKSWGNDYNFDIAQFVVVVFSVLMTVATFLCLFSLIIWYDTETYCCHVEVMFVLSHI